MKSQHEKIKRKIQARNIPEDVHKAIAELAMKNERSMESQIRYILSEYVSGNFNSNDNFFPAWMMDALKISAKHGYRSFRYEVLKRLTESLNNDGVFPPEI